MICPCIQCTNKTDLHGSNRRLPNHFKLGKSISFHPLWLWQQFNSCKTGEILEKRKTFWVYRNFFNELSKKGLRPRLQQLNNDFLSYLSMIWTKKMLIGNLSWWECIDATQHRGPSEHSKIISRQVYHKLMENYQCIFGAASSNNHVLRWIYCGNQE